MLKAVTTDLDRLSNATCHVARHGGEEFVILLRGQTSAQAMVILERARIDLAERNLVNRTTDEPFGSMTFSAGRAEVLSFPGRSDAVKAADSALYKSKREGRNRIVIASTGVLGRG